MNHRIRVWTAALGASWFAIVSFVACDVEEFQLLETLDPGILQLPGPADGENGDRAAALSVIGVEPLTVSPGDLLRVVVDLAAFGDGYEAFVEIGGRRALIHTVADAYNVDVLVPLAAAGAADVRVRSKDYDDGDPGRVNLLPAAAMQLDLVIEGERIGYLGRRPRIDGLHEFANEYERRIGFDVFTSDGGFVFTGVVDHPAGGQVEVFDELPSGQREMRREKTRIQDTFSILIPNLPKAIIRFYDVPPAADHETMAGRTQRTFLDEIHLKG
ncbi:MAG: hypothetical protein V3T70_00375 [Phycisphaerae bacterium]